MEDAFTRRNHPAWRGTRRARRPRAHGSAEASPAQHHCTLRARTTCRANARNARHTPPAITAAVSQSVSQSTADDLASLLCSLLCYTLTSLLCTSCSFLQHAEQRHSRATLPVRHAFAKRLRARVPLRHRAASALRHLHGARQQATGTTRRSLDDHGSTTSSAPAPTPSSRPPSSARLRRAA